MLELVDLDFGNIPVEGLQKFMERVVSFSAACKEKDIVATSARWYESDEAKIQSMLQLGGPCCSDFECINLLQLACDESDLDFEKACKEATWRLTEKVNTLGLSWLKGQMSDLNSESAKNIAASALVVLKSPTKMLQDAITTCGLITKSQNLDSLAGNLKVDLGLAGVSDLTQWYVQVSSVDQQLMEAISPQAFQTCLKFQKTVDGVLKECCAMFAKKIAQLTTLSKKYELPGLFCLF